MWLRLSAGEATGHGVAWSEDERAAPSGKRHMGSLSEHHRQVLFMSWSRCAVLSCLAGAPYWAKSTQRTK